MNIVYAPTPIPSGPGVYVDIEQPSPAQPPENTPMIGLVFEAPRGEVDVAYDLGSLSDYEFFFGMPASDPSGKPLSGHLAARHLFELGVQKVRGVRVAGSTLATGYLLIKNANGVMCALHATTPGSWVGNLSFVVTQNTVANTWGLTITDTSNPNTPADVLTGLPFGNNAALISAINAAAQLVTASQPVLQPPSAAPTITASTASGTVAAGTYYGIATYTNANGETIGSPETAVVTLSGAGQLTISVPTLTGATGFKIYLTAVGGAQSSETFAGSGTPGTNLVLSAPWTASTQRPPQKNTATTGAGDTSALPTAGTFTVPTSAGTSGAPGADGANCGALRHLGDTVSGPNGGPSGANALFGFDQDPGTILAAGAAGTDTTQWAAFGALASANAAICCVGFTPGTTSAAARSTVLGLTTLIAPSTTSGMAVKAAWPAVVVNDPAQGQQTVPSHAYLAGITAITPRQTAAFNKPLVPSSVAGATGWSFVGTDIKATPTDLSLLNDTAAGVYVNVLTPRIPAKGTGFFTDNMLAPRAAGVPQPSFEVRVRNYLARLLYVASGDYYGEPITDDLMAQAQLDLTGLLDIEAADGLIPQNDAGATTAAPAPPVSTGKTTKTTKASSAPQPTTVSQPAIPGSGSYVAYTVECDRTVNTPATLAAGQLIIVVQVAIAPNANQVVIALNAGVAVVISDSVNGALSTLAA